MNPKTQHWVPQLYLRHFATPDTINKKKGQQQIHVQLLAETAKPFKANIDKVAAENYLYSPIDPFTGERNWDVEHRLASFESFIAKAWASFVDHELPITGDSNPEFGYVPHGDMLRQAITMFIMQLHYRNPYNKQKIEKLAKQQHAELEKLPKDSNGIPQASHVTLSSGETVGLDLSDWADYKSIDEKFVENVFLSMQKSGDRQLYDALYNKKWQILMAKERHFLTSDRPVAVHNPKVGIANSTVYFPISPRKCLVMLDGEFEQGYVTDCDEDIPLFNYEILCCAEERVYSHVEHVSAMNDILVYHDQFLSKLPSDPVSET